MLCTISSSSHKWMHAGCVQKLVSTHIDLLAGHLGQKQQFEEKVCWPDLEKSVQPPLFTHIKRSNRPLPGKEGQLIEFCKALAVFTPPQEDDAVERHCKLQVLIKESLEKDARKTGDCDSKGQAVAKRSAEQAAGGRAEVATASPKRQKLDFPQNPASLPAPLVGRVEVSHTEVFSPPKHTHPKLLY